MPMKVMLPRVIPTAVTAAALDIGFSVPDLKPLIAKIKANGFKMITTDSVATNVKVTNDIAAASPTTNIAFALGPDDVKVEFVEVKSQKAPIQLHHIHFFGQMNTEMQAWYAKTFGAKMLPANPGSAFVQDQLPGLFLNFTPSPAPTVGTTGRAIDHIGFELPGERLEVLDLEADVIDRAARGADRWRRRRREVEEHARQLVLDEGGTRRGRQQLRAKRLRV